MTAPLMLLAPVAHAETSEPSLAFVAGASVFLAGFAVGAVIVATSASDSSQTNAGWLTMQSAFALAPFTSHALSGEWTRAGLFTAIPAACLAGSATLIAAHPTTIVGGELEDQRVIWSLFGVGLLSSLVGVVDSALADKRSRESARRSVAFTPIVGARHVGLGLGGVL
jgi:hypothetical protein